jgi:hypothetical protein
LGLPSATVYRCRFPEEFNRPMLDRHENLSESRSSLHFVQGAILVEHEPGPDDVEVRLRFDAEHRQTGAVFVGEVAAIDRWDLRREDLTKRRHAGAIGPIAGRKGQLPARKARKRFLRSTSRTLARLSDCGSMFTARHG